MKAPGWAVNFDRMPTQPSKRVSIQRTEGEWARVLSVLQSKNQDVHGYLRRESSRLVNNYKECGTCVTPAAGDVKRIRHKIPHDIYLVLAEIAEKQGKDVGTVLDEYLITPLLRDKDAAL